MKKLLPLLIGIFYLPTLAANPNALRRSDLKATIIPESSSSTVEVSIGTQDVPAMALAYSCKEHFIYFGDEVIGQPQTVKVPGAVSNFNISMKVNTLEYNTSDISRMTFFLMGDKGDTAFSIRQGNMSVIGENEVVYDFHISAPCLDYKALVGSFVFERDYPGPRIIYVPLENGQTEIDFDLSQIQLRHYQIKGLNPAGEQFVLPVVDVEFEFDEQGEMVSWEFIPKEEGNCQSMFGNLYFGHKSLKGGFSFLRGVSDFWIENYDGPLRGGYFDFYTNCDDPDFFASQTVHYTDMDGMGFMVSYPISWEESQVLKNSPDGYHYYEPSIAAPYYDEYDFQPSCWMVSCHTYYKDHGAGGLATDGENLFSMGFAGVENWPQDWNWSVRYGRCTDGAMAFTKLPPLFFDKANTIWSDPLSQFFCTDEPGCCAFAYECDMNNGIFGSGPAILAQSIKCNSDNTDSQIRVFLPEVFSFGTYGEVRELDSQLIRISVDYNGEQVCSNLQVDSTPLGEFLSSKPLDGILSFTSVNDNQSLHQMQVVTTAVSSIDLATEDMNSPTLVAYTLRDSDGKVGYECKTTEGSTLCFAAADVNYDNVQNEYAFSCPGQFRAEYAPHGSEVWKALELDKPYGEDYQPAIGWVFTATMDQILLETDVRYYDLRLSMTDDAGNTQSQTICPAFYVAQTSGVQPLAYCNGEIKAVYGLDGVQRATLHRGINIVIYTDGQARLIRK